MKFHHRMRRGERPEGPERQGDWEHGAPERPEHWERGRPEHHIDHRTFMHQRGPHKWFGGFGRGRRGPGGPGGFGGPGEPGRHGGRGGPGDPGWRGRRGTPRVGRGDVRAAILSLLAEQPLHGYEIMQQISERSGGIWRPSPGSVYPALQLLEDQGWVRSEQSEGRKVYHLTDAGREYVQQHKEALDAAWVAVTDTVDEGVLELRSLLDQVSTALGQVAQVATVAQISEARELLVNTRRRLYRILADADSDTERLDQE